MRSLHAVTWTNKPGDTEIIDSARSMTPSPPQERMSRPLANDLAKSIVPRKQDSRPNPLISMEINHPSWVYNACEERLTSPNVRGTFPTILGDASAIPLALFPIEGSRESKPNRTLDWSRPRREIVVPMPSDFQPIRTATPFHSIRNTLPAPDDSLTSRWAEKLPSCAIGDAYPLREPDVEPELTHRLWRCRQRVGFVNSAPGIQLSCAHFFGGFLARSSPHLTGKTQVNTG